MTCTFNDQREPWVTFNVTPPAIFSVIAEKTTGIKVEETTFGILLPSIQFYRDGIAMIIFSSFLGIIISTIIYNYVLLSRKKIQQQQQQQQSYSSSNSNTAYMVAFGIIIPTCFLFPYAFVAMTNMQNTITRQLLCLPCVMYAFRCLEALYGFSPPIVTSSPSQYALYFTLPVESSILYHNHHEKEKNGASTVTTAKATAQDVKQNLMFMFRTAIIMSTYFSLLLFYGFEPFSSKNAMGDDVLMRIPQDYLSLVHLVMFQLGLSFTGAYFAFLYYILTGDKCVDLMCNPVMEATSPSDFWGRRWNRIAHGFLKRGVFKPILKYSSSFFVASLGAFIASGLFHEYIVHLVFMYKREPRQIYNTSFSCPTGILEYKPQLGSNMAFFAWNGVLIVFEKLLGKHQIIKRLAKGLPRCVVTLFIIMSALPVAHWLSNPYVRGGYFYDLQEGFPIVTKIA